MSITSEQILSNLPALLLMWTTLTLAWGVYINVVFQRMMSFADRFKKGRRAADMCNSKFIFLANLALTTYLLFEPHLASMGDAIVVINTFYNVYLVSASVTVARWWMSRDKHLSSEHSDDHILT